MKMKMNQATNQIINVDLHRRCINLLDFRNVDTLELGPMLQIVLAGSKEGYSATAKYGFRYLKPYLWISSKSLLPFQKSRTFGRSALLTHGIQMKYCISYQNPKATEIFPYLLCSMLSLVVLISKLLVVTARNTVNAVSSRSLEILGSNF